MVLVLSTLEQKFNELEDKNGWNALFAHLKNDASKQELDQKLKCHDAKAPSNIRSNRYRDVLPYDDSRVRLIDSALKADYINASNVPVPKAGRHYILTQGPLNETTNDFWQMVWQENSHMIVMLNKTVEKNTVKCCQYFPNSVGCSQTYDNFEVNCTDRSEHDHFVVRNLLLKKRTSAEAETSSESDEVGDEDSDGCEQREVFHYQFTTWPDFGVPARTTDFLEFLLQVRKSGLLNYKKFGPPVVHCSAGIGRSGTFVIVDAVLVMAQLDGSVSSNIDIIKLVLELRCYRMGLIQTADQLRFCWKAVIDALKDPAWIELLDKSCYDRGLDDKRPCLKRTPGNQMTTGTSAISVDNSELIKRKRSRPSSDLLLTAVADSDGALDDSISTATTGQDEGSSYEIRRRIQKDRNERTRKRVEEIKKKMKQSEAWQPYETWSRRLAFGAAACVFVGVAVYFCFWKT